MLKFTYLFLLLIFIGLNAKDISNLNMQNPNILLSQEDFDVTYYELDLNIDISAKSVSGSMRIRGVALNDLTQVILNFYEHMQVDSVTGWGQNLSYLHQNQLLTTDLPSTIAAGNSFDFSVYYSGLPMAGNTPGYGLIFTSYNSQDLVYSYNWPFFARTFLPCKDHPSDKADSVRLIITVPQNFTVAANGILQSETIKPGNKKEFNWLTKYPLTTYGISLNIHPFDVTDDLIVTQSQDSIFGKYYSFPNHSANLVPKMKSMGISIQNIFDQIYGQFPYINEKYGLCEGVINGGMEHPTILTMNYSAFFSDIVVHESAHEYFGNMISIAGWEHIWLSEGFATYSEALYQEVFNGSAAYRQEMNTQMAGAGEGAIYRYDISTPGSIIPYNIVYLKASAVLHMLRYVMGDTAFFQMMRDYVQQSAYRYGNIDTEQFRQFCEIYYGADLGWFFNPWIYENGKMAAAYYHFWNDTADSLIFKIHSKPSTSSGSACHRMPMPILFTTVQDSIFKTEWVDSQTTNLTIAVTDTQNLQLQFDPQNFILKSGFDFVNTPELIDVHASEIGIDITWHPFFNFTDYEVSVFQETTSNSWQLIQSELVNGFDFNFTPPAAGRFGFSIAAKSGNHKTLPSQMKTAYWSSFSLASGILIVDETRNGSGANMWNPTDAAVDSFYSDLLSSYSPTEFDVLTAGRPVNVLDIADYGLIIWHHDVQNISYISQSEQALKNYLDAGGKLILSGLKLIQSLSPEFQQQYLGIHSFQIVSQPDFKEAASEIFTELPVDTAKINVPFYNNLLPNISVFSLEAGASQLYSFNSASGNPLYHQFPVGVADKHIDPHAVTLGFPLYFMQPDSVKKFIGKAIHLLAPVNKISVQSAEIARDFVVLQAYPNPFNPGIHLQLNLKTAVKLNIAVYNILGQKVKIINYGILKSGHHKFYWDGSNNNGTAVASGIYIVQINGPNIHQSQKILLQK